MFVLFAENVLFCKLPERLSATVVLMVCNHVSVSLERMITGMDTTRSSYNLEDQKIVVPELWLCNIIFQRRGLCMVSLFFWLMGW